MLTNNLLLIFLFYLIGSLPFALILTKLSGFGDIRNIGSGNVGATNVLRTGNKILAFIVLLLDILKGFIPFLIIHIYFHEFVFLNKIILCHFVILGHIFPIQTVENHLIKPGGGGCDFYLLVLYGSWTAPISQSVLC